MIAEFKCNKCNFKDDYFFTSSDQVASPVCPTCNNNMTRMLSTFKINTHGIKRNPANIIETGNEYPEAYKQQDRYDNVEKTMHEVIDSNVDLDGSGDYELQKVMS